MAATPKPMRKDFKSDDDYDKAFDPWFEKHWDSKGSAITKKLQNGQKKINAKIPKKPIKK